MEENENEDGGIVTGGNSKGTRGRTLLPAARYLTAIEHVEKTLAQSTGNPRLSFTFRVAAGEHEGRKLFDDVYLTDSGLWKLDAISEAVGIEKGTKVSPDDPAALINMFQGKQLFVTLSVDTYTKDGEEREGRKITSFDTTAATKPPERRDAPNKGGEGTEASA